MNVVAKFEGQVPATGLGTPGTVDINHGLGTELLAGVTVISHVTKQATSVAWRTVGEDIVRLDFGSPINAGEFVVVVTG